MWRLLFLALLACAHTQAPRSPLVVQRPYAVQVPSTYDAAHAAPVLIDLPSFTSDAFEQESYLKLGRAALAHGALYVMVNGTKNPAGTWFWNATDACCDFYHQAPDDVAYLDAVIDDVAARYTIDRKRVWIVGHSNGGFMAYRYACERAGRVAAFVSLAGANYAGCAPSEPVAVLQIHGDADGTVKYAGGSLADADVQQRWAGFGLKMPATVDAKPYPGARASLEPWLARDGCTQQATVVPRDLDAKLEGAETEVTTWTCRAGGVELWTIHGGTHLPEIDDSFGETVYTWLAGHGKP